MAALACRECPHSHCRSASLTEAGDAGEHNCVADCEGHVCIAGMGCQRLLIRAPTGRCLLCLLGAVLQMMHFSRNGDRLSQLSSAVLNGQGQPDASLSVMVRRLQIPLVHSAGTASWVLCPPLLRNRHSLSLGLLICPCMHPCRVQGSLVHGLCGWFP